MIQSSSGETLVHGHDHAVTNLPIATGQLRRLHQPGAGRRQRQPRRRSASTGGGATNFMMDGVSTMDTGSNRLMIAVNVESIAEVKVLMSSYQAEFGRSSGLQITAVTKSGTNRFRGSVYDVERNSDWNANSKTNILNGDPKTTSEAARLGLLDRRSGRQARRQQQAVLLLRAGVRAAHRRQQRRALPRADRARAAGRLLADDRQQRQPVSVHQGSAARPARARRPSTGGVLRRRRRARPDSGRTASTRPA